jgi:hypothetical protein
MELVSQSVREGVRTLFVANNRKQSRTPGTLAHTRYPLVARETHQFRAPWIGVNPTLNRRECFTHSRIEILDRFAECLDVPFREGGQHPEQHEAAKGICPGK